MSAGKALIGGPFELVDMKGATVTNKDFEGHFLLVYFGFTNCPDVCPDQLDKLTEAINEMGMCFLAWLVSVSCWLCMQS